MRTAVFILCLALSSITYGGKCQEIAQIILNHPPLFSIGTYATAHTVGHLMFMPQFELTKGPGIEVVGSLFASKKTGERVAKDLVGFDRAMSDLGLKKTKLTKVIVSDRRPLPGIRGPRYFTHNYFNLWRKSEANDTILLQPILYYRQGVTNPMVLFHERTHSLMSTSTSYTSFNSPIREGLADFLPAHYTGNPKLEIATDVGSNIDAPPSLPLSTSDDPHNTGKVFSYTLWNLRERMNQEKMTALLKSFIDGLDQYYESFKRQRSFNGFYNPHYEYFMAVLKKTLQEKGEIQEAGEFIEEMASKLELDIAVINDIANSITKSSKNFYVPTKNANPILMAKMYILGTAAIAIEGYLLYALFF